MNRIGLLAYLNLGLHELREREDVELGVAPDQVVVAGRDLVETELLPVLDLLSIVGVLHEVINEELKDAVCRLLISNRILAILELHFARLIEEHRVSKIKVDHHLGYGGLIGFQGSACARPGCTIIVPMHRGAIIVVHLARGLHPQRHGVAIVAVEVERAHSAIDQDAATADAIRVFRARVAPDLRLVRLPIDCRILAILASVLAGQAEDRLRDRMHVLINSAEVHHIFRALVHW